MSHKGEVMNRSNLIACLSLLVFSSPTFLLAQQLPTGTKGTLNLAVQVEDELGYDTVSQVVEMKNIKASEIEPFIQARLSRWGAVQVNDALNMVIITDKKAKLNDLVALVHQLDSPKLKEFVRLETVSIPLNYTDPRTVQGLISPQLSQEGSMIVDSSHNALVITDLSSKIDTIKRMLDKIDVFIPQVVIDAGVVEISDDYMSKVGIDWNALRTLDTTASLAIGGGNGQGATNISTQYYGSGSTYVNTNSTVNAPYQQNWNLNGTLNLNQFFDIVNVLSNKNQASVLTKTSIITANNQSGVITAGQRVYYRPVGSQPPPNEYQGYGGLTVNVIPQIGQADVIILTVNANLDDLTGWSPDGNPIFENRSAQSKITLKDGETFVLGGMMKTTEIETEGGIPVLKDILPFIFSAKSKTKVKRDVLVLLTPHIKRDSGNLPDKDTTKAKIFDTDGEKTPDKPVVK